VSIFVIFRNTISAKDLTPLALAVILNRGELVLDLLIAGADVNFVNESGKVIIAPLVIKKRHKCQFAKWSWRHDSSLGSQPKKVCAI
jgi:ankyrin repeat protein